MIELITDRPQFDILAQKYKVLMYNEANDVKVNIFINKLEAQEILLAEDNIELEKSNIFQLFSQILMAYEIRIDKIEILFRKNKYCALIEFLNVENNFFSNIVSIGDAMVLSVRYSIPLIISESLFKKLTLNKDLLIDNEFNEKKHKNKMIELEKLRAELKNAISNEDYEVAALIRDKINQI